MSEVALFQLNRHYTRDEIQERIGGGVQSYLPTKNGHVTCACLTPKLNPQAPGLPRSENVILVGSGPRVEGAGVLLSKQSGKIPVFLKDAVNRWRYVGDFSVLRSSRDRAEIDRWKADRSDVRLLVFMKQ